jgi:hypothetical protein
MTWNLDVQIIQKRTDFLVLEQRDDEKTTTLKFIRDGEHLTIGIGIETKHPKRTTYEGSVFRCGPAIADMIAEACTKECTEVTHAAI